MASPLSRCELVAPTMSAAQAAQALKTLAGKINQKGGVGVGSWKGTVHGAVAKNGHKGEHVAVFTGKGMLAPFGPLYDEQSEASALLFAIALAHADVLADALAKL